jgi:hypothetical protein
MDRADHRIANIDDELWRIFGFDHARFAVAILPRPDGRLIDPLARRFDLTPISGTLRQQRLYSRLGFLPFAYPVGTDQTMYQPLQLPLQRALASGLQRSKRY